jgi:hypothetical protein
MAALRAATAPRVLAALRAAPPTLCLPHFSDRPRLTLCEAAEVTAERAPIFDDLELADATPSEHGGAHLRLPESGLPAITVSALAS